MESSNKRVRVKLSNESDNVYFIIGRVAKALKRANLDDMANEFTKKARNAQSYDEVLQLCFEYVEVE